MELGLQTAANAYVFIRAGSIPKLFDYDFIIGTLSISILVDFDRYSKNDFFTISILKN